jgi:hypothetical protein
LALGGLSYEHERATNGGYGADSGPFQDDPGRLTFRPFETIAVRSAIYLDRMDLNSIVRTIRKRALPAIIL